MKKLFMVITTSTLMLSLLAASTAANAQTSNPESVIRGMVDALNAGDVEAALALVVDDVVITLIPPPEGQGVFVGKEAVRTWWQQFTSNHGHIELTDFAVTGETAAWKANISEDFFANLGLATVTFNGVGIVQGGLLKSYTWSMTDASLALLQSSITRQQNREVVERLYTEVFNGKNLEVADAIIDANIVDHDLGDTGIAAIKTGIAALLVGLPDLKVTIDPWVIDGDLVVTRVTFQGTHQGEWFGVAPTGKPVQWTHIDIQRIQNGKITEIWHTVPVNDILQQIGYQLVPPTQ